MGCWRVMRISPIRTLGNRQQELYDTITIHTGDMPGGTSACPRGSVEFLGEVFARKASGLVREASLLDTFGLGFMNMGIGVSIWNVTSWGVFLAPQGNLLLAVFISSLMCVFGVALVWGMLGGSMPRSGGDYIPNSRIIHPTIGVAVSMANAGFIMTFWIAVLAPWVADPGMVILGGLLGYDTEWFTTPTGLFVVASIVNIWGFIIVSLGLKHYNTWQRIVMFSATFCLIVVGIVMTTTSHASFVSDFNAAAADYGSYNYDDMIAQADVGYQSEELAGIGVPDKVDWAATFMLFPMVSYLTAYGYMITFICGEVKRPQRNIILGQMLAVIVPSIFAAWFAWGIPRLFGTEFMQAAAYYDNGSNEDVLAGFTFPSGANYISMMSVLVLDNKVLLFIFGLTFILYDILWMPISYIAWNRAAFAWGMDRLGPMWFTDVNPKYATAVKNNYVLFVLGELGILIYALNAEYILSLGITAMEALSVWSVTAIAAIVFPYVRRAKVIWDASPYKWKLAGIPVITWAGVLNLIYVVILLYELETTEGIEWIRNYATWIYIAVWVAAVAWYFVWKSFWRQKGIDITLAWKELPPA